MAGLSALPPGLRSLRPVRTLEANLEKGRLAHAILLKGEDLAQLESVAAALAATILGAKGAPQNHPDFFSLRPAKKARFIIVGKRDSDEPNTVRRLIRDLNQSSNQGGYKVAVIYEADRMNAQSANAFLKTLEEPPRQTLILLLSTRPYDLIETIRSRCFQFKIPSGLGQPPEPAWAGWLADYRDWIQWLQREPEDARRHPDRAILRAYGLVSRFVGILEAAAAQAWQAQADSLPEHLTEEELEAMKIGQQKGVRDKLLVGIEESTRQAAIELSHHVPFPAAQLAQAVAALESVTGLLALNMKDDTALEAFFLQSLRTWAAPPSG
jgi:DNA polymerase III subunit delta'